MAEDEDSFFETQNLNREEAEESRIPTGYWQDEPLPAGAVKQLPPREDNVYWIPVDNLPKLRLQIEKLSKAAESTGSDPIEYVETDEGLLLRIGQRKYAEYRRVIVKGPAPKYAGWEFVAKLEHHPAGNMVYAVPAKTVDSQWYKAPSDCQHCSTQRKRNFTYLVQNDSGDVLQLGSSCLADFLGHRNPEEIAFMAELLTSLDGDVQEFAKGGGSNSLIPLMDVLVMSAACMREFGWASRMSKSPTSQRVARQLWPPRRTKYEEPDPPVHVKDVDKELAATARAWAAGLDKIEDNYLQNLHVIASEDWITPKQFGLAVSMIVAYQRAMDQQVKRDETKQKWQIEKDRKAKSQWIGEVGKRVDLKLFVYLVMPMSGQFASFLHKMYDEAGNEYSWFGSSQLDTEQWYEVKATIKAHTTYKETKETQLTRVKVIEKPVTSGDPKDYEHDQWDYRISGYTGLGKPKYVKDSSGRLIKDTFVEGQGWTTEYVTPHDAIKKTTQQNPPTDRFSDLHGEAELQLVEE